MSRPFDGLPPLPAGGGVRKMETDGPPPLLDEPTSADTLAPADGESDMDARRRTRPAPG
jgi:hypothetical protein